MYQRKTTDSSNGRGKSGARTPLALNGHNSSCCHDEEAPPSRQQRPLRRRRRTTGNPVFDGFGPALGSSSLLLPMGTMTMVLLGVLWIRMLWKIGSLQQGTDGGSVSVSVPTIPGGQTNHPTTTTTTEKQQQQQQQQKQHDEEPLFRLLSEDAPSCSSPTLEGPEDIDVTLVTQLSDDRLWMMEHHCERYGPHAVSIAVYSNQTLEAVRDQLRDMGCQIRGDQDNSNSNSNSRRHSSGGIVAVRVLDASKHGSWNDYPVNDLRNLALSTVRTSHILYADVDFWPSEGLYESLLLAEDVETGGGVVRRRLWEDPMLAVVVPAFQLERTAGCRDETKDCREAHVPRMPRTLEEIRTGYEAHAVRTFDPFNRGGHGSTDYKHWFRYQQQDPPPPPQRLLGDTTTDTAERNSNSHNDNDNDNRHRLYDIPCLKSHRYEPFLVLRYCRELTPPFQSAFSGYGKNKMTWTMQVAASGFVFAQLGGAYLVHYPHAISESRQHWNEAPKALQPQQKQQQQNYNIRKPKKSDGDLGFERYHRGKVDDLYLKFKDWLRVAIPADKARMPLCENAQDDDSKLWVHPDRKKAWN